MSRSHSRKVKKYISKQSSSSHDEQEQEQDKEEDDDEEDEEYEVEYILDSRINPKTKAKEYLVKWKNYPEDDSTWEPKDHLDNVKDIIARFERSSKKPNATKNDSSSNAPKKGSSTATGKKDEQKKTIKPSELPKRRSMIQKKKEMEVEDEKEMSDQDEEQEVTQFKKKKRGVGSEEKEKQQKENQESDDEKQDGKGDDSQELVFVAVLDRRDTLEGSTEYLIHFQDIENQWVDESQLEQIKDDIAQFNKKKDAQLAIEMEQESKKAQKNKNNIVQKKSTAKRSAPASQSATLTEKNNNNETDSKSDNSSEKKATDVTEKPLQIRKECQLKEVEYGDFKTDNVERIELQGEFQEILSSRFEVFWKTRKDGITPASVFYSSSYIRKYEPAILIEYLINMNQQSGRTVMNNSRVGRSRN